MYKTHSKKLIVHCGGSKNGSTSIQSTLLNSYEYLNSCDVDVLCVLSKKSIEIEGSEYFNDLTITSVNVLAKKFNVFDGAFHCSFAELYELYKYLRVKRDCIAIINFSQFVINSILESFNNYGTVVVSAEGFETSLCLQDRFFKRFVKILSNFCQVNLIFYEQDPVKYIISSWFEWGWIDKYKLSEWLVLSTTPTSSKLFFSILGQSYTSCLLSFDKWIPYWSNNPNIVFKSYNSISNTCEHFFYDVLGLNAKHIEFQKFRSNQGWPKSKIRIFPYFFDFFSSDYHKYQVIRQLLIDKHLSRNESPEAFNLLLFLVGIYLGQNKYLLNADQNRIVLSSNEFILKSIDLVFEDVPTEELSDSFQIFSETVVFYNQLSII